MRLALLASYVLAALFLVLAFVRKNNEFVIYAVTLIIGVAILHAIDKHFHFSNVGLWGFFGWMLLHLFGGLGSLGGVRTYDAILIPLIGAPYSVLKYDQLLHFLCYVVIALLMYSVVQSITKPKASYWTVFTVTVLAASAIGALNEIIEFMPVVLWNAPGPGGYINTAIDLIMNLLGALVGTAWAMKK
jgi:uncharacterized membrane protein YjdF